MDLAIDLAEIEKVKAEMIRQGEASYLRKLAVARLDHPLASTAE